jgi:hypothetical protein
MILADFECLGCKKITEAIVPMGSVAVKCPDCGDDAKRIISFGRGPDAGRDDPAWIKSVVDVVDKDSQKPHVKAFVRNPTRRNYHAWMKGEGLRPLENERGAPPVYRKPREAFDHNRVAAEVARRRQERNRIEI